MNIQDFAVPLEDQLQFAKFLAYIIQVDGSVTAEEKQAINSLIFAWQLKDDAVKEINQILENGTSLDILSSPFKNRKTSYLLVQELITLASLDGSYAENEKIAVHAIAARFGVSATRVEEIEGWVKSGIEWREKGLSLVTPEGV